jgi:hypothetical protein
MLALMNDAASKAAAAVEVARGDSVILTENDSNNSKITV